MQTQLPVSGHTRPCAPTPRRPHALQCTRRVHRLQRDTRATSVAVAETLQKEDTRALVDEICTVVDNSDNGRNLSDETKSRIDILLDELEVRGKAQQPRPLQDPLLWGNYNVAYTSTRRSKDQQGDPAGGRFRNSIGRALFQTTGLYQSCIAPDVVTNKVSFRLFGFINGYVGLRGKVIPVDDETVRVAFEPTVVSFGQLHLRLGSPSEVTLTTTYLDERVRLGKGSRGSLFVFTRGGAADSAEMDLVGTQRTDRSVAALASVTYMAVMLGALACVLSPAVHPVLKGLAGCVAVVGGLVAAVLRNGGIVEDDTSYKMRQASEQQGGSNNAAAKPIVG